MSSESCSKPSPWLRRLLAGVGVWVWIPASALQAQQTGSVAGSVTDAESLRPVAEVRVFIAGTSSQAYTDEQGGYLLAGLPAGEVEVSLERLGYGAATATVQVMAGGTAALDFDLQVSGRRPRRAGGDGHRSSATP